MVSTSWASVSLSTLSVAVPSEAGSRDDLAVVLVAGLKKSILYLSPLHVVASVVAWAGAVVVAVVLATGGSVAAGVALVVVVVAASVGAASVGVGAIADMVIAVVEEEALATAVTEACEVAMVGEEISEAPEVASGAVTTLAEGAEEVSGIHS